MTFKSTEKPKALTNANAEWLKKKKFLYHYMAEFLPKTLNAKQERKGQNILIPTCKYLCPLSM